MAGVMVGEADENVTGIGKGKETATLHLMVGRNSNKHRHLCPTLQVLRGRAVEGDGTALAEH